MKTGEWDRDQFLESIEQEKQKEKEKQQLRERYADYREKIDALLEKKAYGQLQDYFQTEEIKVLSNIEDDVALFCIILSIYSMEVEEGVEPGILDGVRNMQEIEERWLKLKFLMWKMEFTEEKEKLAEFLERYQISVPFLKYLVNTSSFDKANTAFKLAMILKNAQKPIAAFAMLNYANELAPNEELVFCEMADICMNLGQYKEAQECIRRIENPTGILVAYLERWGV